MVVMVDGDGANAGWYIRRGWRRWAEDRGSRRGRRFGRRRMTWAKNGIFGAGALFGGGGSCKGGVVGVESDGVRR